MSEVGQILQATTRDISVSRYPAEEVQRDMDSYSVCPGNTLPRTASHQAPWHQLSPSSQIRGLAFLEEGT